MYTLAKRFSEAIEKYTAAIDLNPNVAAYYTNRAFCHLKLESYGYAIAYAIKLVYCYFLVSLMTFLLFVAFRDADAALKIDPSLVKVSVKKGKKFAGKGINKSNRPTTEEHPPTWHSASSRTR